MTNSSLTEPQVELSAELLRYVLLRLTRDFVEPEFDLWRSLGADIETFDGEAQWEGRIGAFCAHSVSAYENAVSTFARLGVVERIFGHCFRVLIPVTSLHGILSDRHLLDQQTFKDALFDFFACHVQAEWGSPSRGDKPVRNGTEVELEPNLKARFELAGLIQSEGNSHSWTSLAMNCRGDLGLRGSPSVECFFSEIYSLRTHGE